MENRLPLIGDKFPKITVKTTHGPKTYPDDLGGKWFVFFSHPADFTPVCTTEFVAFEKRAAEFRALGAELVGLSIDQVFSHIKWVEWIKEKLDTEISFPVVADDTGEVAKKLGLIHPGQGTNTVRAVFVVDPEGTIRAIPLLPARIRGGTWMRSCGWSKDYKVATDNGVALPANWPNNELINDGVIIPPATDEATAKERKATYDCYDWWFCHQKLS